MDYVVPIISIVCSVGWGGGGGEREGDVKIGTIMYVLSMPRPQCLTLKLIVQTWINYKFWLAVLCMLYTPSPSSSR